jgi:hypothetical protein
VPTSLLQHYYPRIELHLFYNSIVTLPMLVAVVLHMWPRTASRAGGGHGSDLKKAA